MRQLGEVVMVKMMFQMHVRLPSARKDALRQMRDSHAADLVELRKLLRSTRCRRSQ